MTGVPLPIPTHRWTYLAFRRLKPDMTVRANSRHSRRAVRVPDHLLVPLLRRLAGCGHPTAHTELAEVADVFLTEATGETTDLYRGTIMQREVIYLVGVCADPPGMAVARYVITDATEHPDSLALSANFTRALPWLPLDVVAAADDPTTLFAAVCG